MEVSSQLFVWLAVTTSSATPVDDVYVDNLIVPRIKKHPPNSHNNDNNSNNNPVKPSKTQYNLAKSSKTQ